MAPRRALRGGRGQQGARCAPEVANVRPGVAGAFVETDSGDPAVHVSGEPHPELDRAGIGRGKLRRRDGRRIGPAKSFLR